MRTIDTPKGLAARLGGWSARHKKSVLAGWFVFVALAMLVSMFVPANTLTKADQFTGESGRAEKTLESSFPTPASEMVLIHSGSLTTDDAAFARGISQTAAGFAALPVVDHLRAPGHGDGTGLVSKDRHSALITFTIKGDADTASNRITPVVAAVKDAQRANPALRIEEFGDATSGAQLDKKVQSDLHKAETMSLPITLLILVIAFGAIVAAGVPVLLAISAVLATIGLVSIPSQIFPIDDNASIVITLIGMAVGVDYSLFYLKREREERAAGHDQQTALAIAVGHIRPRHPGVGLHGDGGHGRPVPDRRQELDLVRGRHHPGGRRGHAGLADGASGGARPARQARRQGPHPGAFPAPGRAVVRSRASGARC